MVSTETGASGLALLMSVSGVRPNYTVIGSGSGASVATATWIYGDLDLPKAFSSTDITTQKEITFTSDWSATELSGLTLKCFGVATGSDSSGDLWGIEAFDPNAVTFDGSTDLQIQVTFEVY